MTWDSLICQFDTHESLGYSLLFLCSEGVESDKLFLIQFTEHSQSCHDGRDGFRKFITIEGQSNLEAQCIAAAQSTGFAPSAADECIPHLSYLIGAAIDFKSIFTSVSCSADDELSDGLGGIEHQFADIKMQHITHHFFGERSLHSQLSIVVGAVGETDVIALGMTAHPLPVFVDVRGIDNDKEIVLSHLVNQQVVHCSSILIEHHAIENFSHGHPRYIVGKYVVDIAFSIGTTHGHLAHVRHIEHATGCSHGNMFVLDVCVLNRHVETTERTDEGSQCHVFVIKTGSFVCHSFYFKVTYLSFHKPSGVLRLLSVIMLMRSSRLR